MRWRIAVAAAGVLASGAVAAGVAPASAGGSWLSPVKDTYQPGEVATLVGYTTGGRLGWLENGPFSAYLLPGSFGYEGSPTDGLPLGPLTLEPVPAHGVRASLSFALPADLPPGPYQVAYCGVPCIPGVALGDLIGGNLFVGIEPGHPLYREWPADEPELANLAAGAAVTRLPEPGEGPPRRLVPTVIAETAPAPAPPAPPAPDPVPPVSAPVAEEGDGDSGVWPLRGGLRAAAVLVVGVGLGVGMSRRHRRPPQPEPEETHPERVLVDA